MARGAAIGFVAGFVGGGFAAMIGGPTGALVGGFASDVTTQLLGTGSVDIGRSLLDGAVSFEMYHVMQYMQFRAMGRKLGPLGVTYEQFSKINSTYQRSRFWGREFGVYLNENGSARITPWRDTEKFRVRFRSRLGNVNRTMHAHWARDGQEWVELPNGRFQRFNGDPTSYPAGSYLFETVGGYHSPADIFSLPGYSLIVGRTSSTYFNQSVSNFTWIQPDPFLRFFLFPFLSLGP
jgi:hypothetical protein